MNSTRWCFTLNNYTAEQVLSLDTTLQPYKYLLYGKETATTGTPHLQGYIVFTTMKRLSGVAKLLPGTHWEIAKGSTQDNYAYCTKGSDFAEFGTKPKSPKEIGLDTKDRWTAVIKACRDGTCERDYPMEYFRYHTTATKLSRIKLPTLDSYSGLWYYGPPGTGKSKKARDDYPDLYNKPMNQWWCGFNYEKSVLLDDLGMNHAYMGDYLKTWTDHYPFRANQKHGSMMARPETIIVTSNYHPSDIWTEPMMLAAILRRFKMVHFPDLFTKSYTPGWKMIDGVYTD